MFASILNLSLLTQLVAADSGAQNKR